MEDALQMPAAGTAKDEALPLDFDRIVREHQRQVYRVLLGLVRDPDVADDLTQECFIRAYRSQASFRGEASVSTWLVSIAINLARDHGRSRRWAFWRGLLRIPQESREKALATAEDRRTTAELRMIAAQEVSRLWELVQGLSARQREVFVLRFAEELSLEEIATASGMEVGTVKAHLHRAVALVRKRMGEHAKQTPSE